jgi:hypothetical protein
MLRLSSVRRERSLQRAAGRGLPGGNSLFFCFAKRKVSKRKGDPGCCVPPLRYGQPAVLGPAGVSLNSLRSNNAIPDPSGPALLGASTRGGDEEYQIQILKTTRTRQGESLFVLVCSLYFCPRSRSRLPRPGWAEERRRRRIRDRACLSEASLRETPPELSTAGCPKRSVGTQTAGRLFFGDFLLAKQKKVTCRRATPASKTQQRARPPKQLAAFNVPALPGGQQEQPC